MADFLSDDWFHSANEKLRAAGPVATEKTLRVVFDFGDAPSGNLHAATLTVGPSGANLDAGDHMMADAMIRLSWTDAQALAAGDLTSADALREGKIKIRGDFSVLVTVQPWLQAAFTPS